MADSSFDIVSKLDRQEVDNALGQTAREIATRFDFKGTGATIEWQGDQAIEISASADDRASAVLDVFKQKLVKRDVSLKVLDASEPHGFLDWRFPDSLTLWRDPSLIALVAPRPLLIESGTQDQLFPIAGARKMAPEVTALYQRLGIADRIEFDAFVGRHDFDGETAMAFIDKHLGGAGAASN